MANGRLMNFYLQKPWAITQDALEGMVDLYLRALDRKMAGEKFDPKTVELVSGKPLGNSRTAELREDCIAVIPVTGPIFRHANAFDDISGATSTQVIATDFEKALSDERVKAVVLVFDSPGGDASGINELASYIYDARKKGKKRIIGYVDGQCCSGAWWLASACEEIVTDETGLAGCIGVAAVIRDTRERDEKAGVKTFQFVSTQTPKKRPDPATPEGAAQIQQTLDEIARVFIANAAKYRGVSIEDFKAKFDGGATLVGVQALKAGLVDKIGSFEGLVAELAAELAPPRGGRRASREKTEGQREESQPSTIAKEQTLMALENQTGQGGAATASGTPAAPPLKTSSNPPSPGSGTATPVPDGGGTQNPTPPAPQPAAPSAPLPAGGEGQQPSAPAPAGDSSGGGGTSESRQAAQIPAGYVLMSEADANRLRATEQNVFHLLEQGRVQRAETAVDSLIRAGKIDPYQRQRYVDRFVREARMDDQLGGKVPVTYKAEELNGKPTGRMLVATEGTRVDAFLAEFDAKQPHLMDRDLIASRDPQVLRHVADYSSSQQREEEDRQEGKEIGKETADRLNKQLTKNEDR